MDRHFFISVWAYKSNKMGDELSSYVENKYHHTVVHKNDFLDIKADIQAKMQELEKKYKRCKPFRISFYESGDRYGDDCPRIVVRPNNIITDKIVFCLRSDSVRNDILDYRRP